MDILIKIFVISRHFLSLIAYRLKIHLDYLIDLWKLQFSTWPRSSLIDYTSALRDPRYPNKRIFSEHTRRKNFSIISRQLYRTKKNFQRISVVNRIELTGSRPYIIKSDGPKSCAKLQVVTRTCIPSLSNVTEESKES